MYAAPPVLMTEIHIRMPEDLKRMGQPSHWVDKRGAGPVHSFLEGPSWDREGNFYCTDIPYGRIFKITPDGKWNTFAQWDGEPNGLKIHKDGRLFVADHALGLLSFDPKTAKMETILNRPNHEGFKGLNDLIFNAAGDVFFTDQGQSSMDDPTGRVWRLRATGELDLLYKGVAGPNGILLNKEENLLYVAATRTNNILVIPLLPKYQGVGKVGMFIQLSGSPTGPDGMALDEEGNLFIVHAGFGRVWGFSKYGEPIWCIKSCAGMRTTNIAFGGPDNKTLFITEAEQGVILKAQLPVAGKRMYSHA
ncbi:MAG TPA: SMP-30/gluconolactonase/LRE family protein [Burkholderiales bacterium]|jgi:gluconolactonase